MRSAAARPPSRLTIVPNASVAPERTIKTLTDTGVTETSSTRASSNRVSGIPNGLKILQRQGGLDTPLFGEDSPIGAPPAPAFGFTSIGFDLTGDYEESTVLVDRSTVVDTSALTANFGAVNGAIVASPPPFPPRG